MTDLSADDQPSGLRWALVLSVLAHGVLAWALQSGWAPLKPPPIPEPAGPDSAFEVALVYVDTPPDAPEREPELDTPFYSERSSRAADSTEERDAVQPAIDGSQTEVFRLEDALPPQEGTPQVDAPESVPEESPSDADGRDTVADGAEASTTLTPEDQRLLDRLFGDGALAAGAPAESTATTESDGSSESVALPRDGPPPTRSRPRTLAEVRRRQALAGEAITQDGGAEETAETALVDSKGRSFGAYDRTIQLAVQARWYGMIEDRVSYVRTRGRVQIGFRLLEDGSITRARVVETTVDPIMTSLCRAAITEPAPYGAWPEAMRLEIGEPHRDIVFTFHYR